MVEVLVAMVLVMIAFGMGIMVYFSVLNSDRNRLELEAGLLLSEVVEQTHQRQSWFNETLKLDHLTIEKTVAPYEGMRDRLQTLTVVAYNNNGKVITQCQELIITD